MGGFQPVALDPLPQPDMSQTQAQPSQQRNRPPEPYPAEAGWVGKGGQAANILANFMQGWQTGKNLQEVKKVQAMQGDINSAWMAYQITTQDAQNTASDPNATAEQKQQAELKRSQAWDHWVETHKKYAEPDPGMGGKGGKGGQKKKEGVGGHVGDLLTKMFLPKSPHGEGTTSTWDQLGKSGPPRLEAPSTQEQKARFELSEEKKLSQERDEYSSLIKKDMRTPEEQKRLESLEDELYGPGSSDKRKTAHIQATEAQRVQDDTNAAREKYKKDPGSLNERERTLLQSAGELPKDDVRTPFEAYSKEVGPGKKFKSYTEAADAYYKQEIKVARASRQPSMWDEMMTAGKAVLGEQYAKDDADPAKPHTYRVTIGDKTETRQMTEAQAEAAQKQDKNLKLAKVPRTPSKGDVFEWVSEHMKPSPEDKESAKHEYDHSKPITKAQANQILSPVLATVIQENADWEKYTARGGTAGGGIQMYLKPYKKGDEGWFTRESTARKDYQDFLKAASNELIRRGMGWAIPQLLPDAVSDVEAMEPPPNG